MNPRLRRHFDASPALTFSPLAWLKLQFFCHAGDTEIGGFGISAEEDLLYIEEFRTVRQDVTPMSVAFEDTAVADFFDDCIDQGIHPSRCGRVWLHTHPGASAMPSGTDDETFGRVFGRCDWSVMFILSRTCQTYTKLSFSAGPRGEILLPVQVDWSAWPNVLASDIAALAQQWQQEYVANIQHSPSIHLPGRQSLHDQPSLDDERWWTELEKFADQFPEEMYGHVPFYRLPQSRSAPASDHPSGASG
jgi:proteasome lid subunit RPN8/RPN11